MTTLLAVLLLAGDPPATTDPPATRVKKVESGKKAEAKKDDAKKDEPKKDSLFKRKRSENKAKDTSDDMRLIPEGPTPAKQTDEKKEKSKLTDADKDLVKSLGGALAGDEEDPLARAAQRMRNVEEQLAKLLVEHETVQTQEKIIADLKEVIERAKKRQQQQQQQQQQQNQQQNKQQQQQDMQQQSQQQKQKQGDQAAKKAGGPRNTKEDPSKQKEKHDVWGHLPELERQLLDQSFKEEKLPEFRTQLEKYYSKIAEMSAEKDR